MNQYNRMSEEEFIMSSYKIFKIKTSLKWKKKDMKKKKSYLYRYMKVSGVAFGNEKIITGKVNGKGQLWNAHGQEESVTGQ